MTSLFKKTDPKDLQRQNDRALRGVTRDLNRDKRDLERREKQIELDIKKNAKTGNRAAVQSLAKQLVTIRKQKERFCQMDATVSGVSNQAKVMGSQMKMAGAMKDTTAVMGAMNKANDPQKMAATLKEFETQNMKMEMSEEMMNEALDGMLDESGDEEEQDAVINQVLDEIGIDVKHTLSKAPAAPSGVSEASSSSAKKMTDADIDAMLEKLKA